MKLVCYPALDPSRAARLQSAVPSWTVVQAADVADAAAAIADADCFFGKITPTLLAAAERLRWIQSPTASLEHYVFDELVQHRCTLTNMRGIFSDVIADHVLGYLLCFARNLHTYLRQQQQAVWKPVGEKQDTGQNFVSGPGTISGADRAHLHLGDCTLGIVGLGAIGAEIAKRAAAFEMRIMAVDPRRTDCPPEVTSLCDMSGLDELLATSDFVVIAAPHTPETAGLFDRAKLRQMKRTAFLINIGRGAIVKLDDLVAALEAGEIAGAALDVFEIEPLPPEHALWRMPNVILTPHVAAASTRIAERHLQVLLRNVVHFDRGEPLVNVVDKAAWF